MLAIMLEISASMTQFNTRVYAILETHSIKGLALTSDVSVFTAFTKIYVYDRPHEDA